MNDKIDKKVTEEVEELKDTKVEDYIAEDEGWKLDSNNAENAWDEFVESVGILEAAEALVRSMANDLLANHLVYIFRQYDFDSRYLEPVEISENIEDTKVDEVEIEVDKDNEFKNKAEEAYFENACDSLVYGYSFKDTPRLGLDIERAKEIWKKAEEYLGNMD